VWSNDTPRALAIARRLQAGTVWVNEWHMITTSAPYGGYKQSGIGKELGDEGILEYARSKHVWVDQSRELKKKLWGPIIGLDRIFDIHYD
jgi:aldehyde dehydrogenase (NAD+)